MTFLNNATLETVSLKVTLKFKLRRSSPANVFQLIYISNYRKGLVVPRSAFPWNCYLFQFEREYQSSKRNPKKALIARQRYRMHDPRALIEKLSIFVLKTGYRMRFFFFLFADYLLSKNRWMEKRMRETSWIKEISRKEGKRFFFSFVGNRCWIIDISFIRLFHFYIWI